MDVISALCHRKISAKSLRRNLSVSGLNLIALKDRKFRIGELILEGTDLCHPCSRMEEILGIGGFNSVRDHGGITAKIIFGGTICVGDSIAVFEKTQ